MKYCLNITKVNQINLKKLLLVIFLFFIFSPINSQAIFLEEIIEKQDGTNLDSFGTCHAMDGDTLVVGASYQDSKTGAIYIFNKDDQGNWIQISKKRPDDLQPVYYFGNSVDIQENFIAAAARNYDYTQNGTFYDASGTVYIYKLENESWSLSQQLFSPNPGEMYYFGKSISFSDDYLFISEYRKTVDEIKNAGLCHVYKLNNENGQWVFEKTITPRISGTYFQFGYDVAVSGNFAVVGAYMQREEGTTYAGAAYIYENKAESGWTEITKIKSNEPQYKAKFGCSVSISENYLVAGSFMEDISETEDAGSVYVYNKNDDNWEFQVKLTAPDLKEGDEFGYSVFNTDDYIIVGANRCDLNNNDDDNIGAAYIFKRDNNEWFFYHKLTPSIMDKTLYFGESVSILNDLFIVGASADESENRKGRVFVYKDMGPLYGDVDLNGMLDIKDAISILKKCSIK